LRLVEKFSDFADEYKPAWYFYFKETHQLEASLVAVANLERDWQRRKE